MYQHT